MMNLIISDGKGNAPGFSSMIGNTIYSDVTSFTPESDATYLMSAQAGTGEWRYSYFIKPVDNMHVFFDDLRPMKYQLSIPSEGLKNLYYGVNAASAFTSGWKTYFEVNSNHHGNSNVSDDGTYEVGFIEEFNDYQIGIQATEYDNKILYFYKLGTRPNSINLPKGHKFLSPKGKLDAFEIDTDFGFNSWDAKWILRNQSGRNVVVWEVFGDQNKFSLNSLPSEILSENPALNSYKDLDVRQIRLHNGNRSHIQKIQASHITPLLMEEIESYTIVKNFSR